eukprot:954603-Pyramimonas_sp.AAC.1
MLVLGCLFLLLALVLERLLILQARGMPVIPQHQRESCIMGLGLVTNALQAWPWTRFHQPKQRQDVHELV